MGIGLIEAGLNGKDSTILGGCSPFIGAYGSNGPNST